MIRALLCIHNLANTTWAILHLLSRYQATSGLVQVITWMYFIQVWWRSRTDLWYVLFYISQLVMLVCYVGVSLSICFRSSTIVSRGIPGSKLHGARGTE